MRLSPARKALAESYLPLALALAGIWIAVVPRAREEIRSAAFEGLVSAAIRFDASRDVLFATFARRKIVGAILDELRRDYPLGFRFPWARSSGALPRVLGLPPDLDERPRRHLFTEPDPPVGTWLEATETVELALRGLPVAHQAVMRAIYLDGLSGVQAARRLGRSPSRVSTLHAQALAFLQARYPTMEDFHARASA